MDIEKLKDFFHPRDIEWRIQSSGVKNDKPWARALAYIDNRAIVNRLDEVCGAANWRNEFQVVGEFVLCGIGIKIGKEWVTKWDGADKTDIEAVKGGLSSAMKRSGSTGWGIGRYLYDFPADFVEFSSGGDNNVKIEGKWYKWHTPKVPYWALPSTCKDEKLDEKFNTLLASPCYDGVKRDKLLEWYHRLLTADQLKANLPVMEKTVKKWEETHG